MKKRDEGFGVGFKIMIYLELSTYHTEVLDERCMKLATPKKSE